MTYAAEVLADNPLGYWRLDEPSGTTMNDTSPNAHHGTYVGGPTLGATGLLVGDSDTAMITNGSTDQRGSVADAAWMDQAAWSAEALIRPANVTGTGTIISRHTTLSAFTFRLDANVLRCYIWPSGTFFSVTASTVFTATTKYHVVVTHDGTTAKLYVNGVLDGSAAIAAARASNEPIAIGGISAGSIERFNGTLDEVAFYGTALSAARIAAHYAAALGAVNVPGGTAEEVEQAHHGALGLRGGTAEEVESAHHGTIGLTVAGGTSEELESAHPGAVAVDINVDGGTAEEVEEAHGGSNTGGGSFPGGTAQEVEQAGAGVISQGSGTANNFSGQRVRTGRGIPMWEPDVVPAPLPTSVYVNDVVAAAWDGYTIVNTQLALNDRVEVRKPAVRMRILVAGRDLSYWRGHVTPWPQLQLIEPLLYGPGTLVLPQVEVPYEQPGYGALTWMVPNAPVRIQAVDADNAVVLTLWKGRLLSPSIEGAQLSWGMMGEAAGPAALQDKQIVLAKRRNDLGFWWWGAINQLRLPFKPRLGPNTGITLWNSGGSSLLNYMLDLSAKGWTRNGTQWTCMPDPHESGGAYRVARKDRTTIHATAYLDDHMIVPRLTRDPAEEPNRMFPSSVSPGGRRIRFAVYPVMGEGVAPPFPGHMQSGDTGDDVVALIVRLIVTGYLSLEERPGGYDDDVEDAVRALQRKAGLPVTGEVNNATWLALYDVGITGYDLAGSRILPAEEWDSVRRYDRTPIGNIIRQNPDWDPDQMVVDLTNNMGPDFTRQQDLHWARRNITDPDNPRNWVGTLTFNAGGVIIGEHNPGDPLTPADIQPAHFLRPGMNVWLPTWDGGTLVHISALALSGGPVVADVDTRARDALQVWEVQARNREARQTPSRAFLLNHRSSMMPKDAIIEFDENGGVLEDRHTYLNAGWNHFPQVVGQEGTLGLVHLFTGAKATSPSEFCMAITCREVTDAKWATLIGDPLSPAGNARWVDEDVRAQLDNRYVLLYAAGTDENPCGYYPHKKVNDNGEATGAPVTGEWYDAAGVGYATLGDPVLWVSVYAKHATRLRDGRILKNQGESGS